LALGGGGARGLAHIGVLRVLERERIPIAAIAGTSSGAVVGALYALRPDIGWVARRLQQAVQSDAFKRMRLELMEEREGGTKLGQRLYHLARRIYVLQRETTRLGLVSEQVIDDFVAAAIPDARAEEARIPFAAVAVDLVTGEDVVFRQGPLRAMVRASLSRVGVIPPLAMNGRILVDGGTTNLLPVDAVRSLGADVALGVDVRSQLRRATEFHNGVEIVNRAAAITATRLHDALLPRADMIVSPDVKMVQWANFKRFGYCVQRGEEAMRLELPRLRRLLRRRGMATLLSRLWQ
ncbi:MAG: patatin-like phospholipase family protein, partial [bacterium]